MSERRKMTEVCRRCHKEIDERRENHAVFVMPLEGQRHVFDLPCYKAMVVSNLEDVIDQAKRERGGK